jgi:hypothetical protein
VCNKPRFVLPESRRETKRGRRHGRAFPVPVAGEVLANMRGQLASRALGGAKRQGQNGLRWERCWPSLLAMASSHRPAARAAQRDEAPVEGVEVVEMVTHLPGWMENLPVARHGSGSGAFSGRRCAPSRRLMGSADLPGVSAVPIVESIP